MEKYLRSHQKFNQKIAKYVAGNSRSYASRKKKLPKSEVVPLDTMVSSLKNIILLKLTQLSNVH